MNTRMMREDLRRFSGEQLLWLAVMSNATTRVLIDLELRRRAGQRSAHAVRRLAPPRRAVA
ncbi:hypothetical protein PHYC_00146 [Phycisphaerales bacterium]|nr:hypothetical protein PHYC_00146 [Phycisphaerales bacterium]